MLSVLPLSYSCNRRQADLFLSILIFSLVARFGTARPRSVVADDPGSHGRHCLHGGTALVLSKWLCSVSYPPMTGKRPFDCFFRTHSDQAPLSKLSVLLLALSTLGPFCRPFHVVPSLCSTLEISFEQRQHCQLMLNVHTLSHAGWTHPLTHTRILHHACHLLPRGPSLGLSSRGTAPLSIFDLVACWHSVQSHTTPN